MLSRFCFVEQVPYSHRSFVGTQKLLRHKGNAGALAPNNHQQAPSIDFPPSSLVSKGSTYDLRFFDAYPVVRMPYERRDEGELAPLPSTIRV